MAPTDVHVLILRAGTMLWGKQKFAAVIVGKDPGMGRPAGTMQSHKSLRVDNLFQLQSEI